jgi:hypothetical protein
MIILHNSSFFIFLRFYIFARESTLLPVATAAENINKIKIWRRKAAWEADEKPAHTENEKKKSEKEVEAEMAAPALALLYKIRPPSAPPLPFLCNLAAVSRNLSRPNSNRRPLQISAQGEEDPSIYPRLFLPPFVNWIRFGPLR